MFILKVQQHSFLNATIKVHKLIAFLDGNKTFFLICFCVFNITNSQASRHGSNNQGRRLMTERSWVLIPLYTEWMKRKRINVAQKGTPEKIKTIYFSIILVKNPTVKL